MSEEEVRILLSILHDLFPQKVMRVVTTLIQEDVNGLCKQLDRATPLLKAMLHDRIGQPILVKIGRKEQ